MNNEKTKPTPGPWEIHYGSDGPEIHGEGSTGGLVIADISPEWGGDEIAEANARLIAAAPELLADLVSACGLLYDTGNAGMADHYMKTIRKAKGK